MKPPKNSLIRVSLLEDSNNLLSMFYELIKINPSAMLQLRQENSDLMSHETRLNESNDVTMAPLILPEVLKKCF